MSLKSTDTLSLADPSLTSGTMLNEQVNSIVNRCNEPEFDVIEFLRAESIPGLDVSIKCCTLMNVKRNNNGVM